MTEAFQQILALYETLSDLEKHAVTREICLRLPPLTPEEEILALELAGEELFLQMDIEEEAQQRAKHAP